MNFSGVVHSAFAQYCIGRLATPGCCCPPRAVTQDVEWMPPARVDKEEFNTNTAEVCTACACNSELWRCGP